MYQKKILGIICLVGISGTLGIYFLARSIPAVGAPAPVPETSTSVPEFSGTPSPTETRVPEILVQPTRVPELTKTPKVVLKVTADALRLRFCAGTDCPTLAFLEYGQELTWTGNCEDGWAEVFLQRGWVYAKYIDPEVCY